VVFPFALSFFFNEANSIGTESKITVSLYLSTAIRLILAFGLIFELPVVTFLLAKLKLVTHGWLVRQARYSLLVIFIVAAILTPPDPITQFLLAIPLTLLYGLCIGIAWFVEERATNKSPQTQA